MHWNCCFPLLSEIFIFFLFRWKIKFIHQIVLSRAEKNRLHFEMYSRKSNEIGRNEESAIWSEREWREKVNPVEEIKEFYGFLSLGHFLLVQNSNVPTVFECSLLRNRIALALARKGRKERKRERSACMCRLFVCMGLYSCTHCFSKCCNVYRIWKVQSDFYSGRRNLNTIRKHNTRIGIRYTGQIVNAIILAFLFLHWNQTKSKKKFLQR